MDCRSAQPIVHDTMNLPDIFTISCGSERADFLPEKTCPLTICFLNVGV